ncbi:MAG: YabP/YqfC family sporulation protein [Lachnospiraceae bacterium]
MSSHEKMFLKKAAEAAQIPEDLSRHAVLLWALGQESILIENYKGILEYSGECLVVQAADCRVRICGKKSVDRLLQRNGNASLRFVLRKSATAREGVFCNRICCSI